MVGWHHRLNGREFEQTLGDGEGQGNQRATMGSQRVGQDLATEQNMRYITCWCNSGNHPARKEGETGDGVFTGERRQDR